MTPAALLLTGTCTLAAAWEWLRRHPDDGEAWGVGMP